MASKEAGAKKTSSRPDLATLGGLVLAGAGILGGLMLEGGKLTDIAQVTALMIVLGGTIGAVMVTTPLKTLIRAAKCLGNVFFDSAESPQQIIEELISYATKARKNSIISLESDLPNMTDPFLRKAISLSVDGTDLNELRKMMELDIDIEHKNSEASRQGLRGGRRLRPNHRHHRRGAGPDSGDEAPGKHRRSGPRHRGGVRGHGVRRGVRQPLLSSGGQQDQGAISSRPGVEGADAGRCLRHRGRIESEIDPRSSWMPSPHGEAESPKKAKASEGAATQAATARGLADGQEETSAAA